MSGSPRWKVYDADGEYQASCKEVECAATVVALYGPNSVIRDGWQGRKIVWREGADGCAGESVDECAREVWARVDEIIQRQRERDAAIRERYAASVSSRPADSATGTA